MRNMAKWRRGTLVGICTAFVILSLMYLPGMASVWERMQYWVTDSWTRVTARHHTRDVIIAAIDENSIGILGPWPWPRELYARLVRVLSGAGARAIGLDLILDRPRPGDSILAAAISASKRVVLTVSADENIGHLMDGEGLYVEHVILPSPSLAEAAGSLGHIALIYDGDGVIRHLPTFISDISDQKRIFPAFGIAVAAVAANIDRHEILLSPKRLKLGDMIIPLDQQDRLWIRYQGEPGSFPSVSAADVLTGRIPREVFRDKVVLIGVTSTGLADSWTTPFASSGGMYGAEVHANIVESILDGDVLSGAPPKILPVSVIFAGVAAALVGELAPVFFSAGMLPMGICLIWGLGAAVFLSLGTVFPVAPVASAWATGFVAAFSFRMWSYRWDLRHQEHHLATLSTLPGKPSLEHLCQLIAGLAGADRAYGLFLAPRGKIKIIQATEVSSHLPEDLTHRLKDPGTLWDGDRLVTDLGNWANMRPETWLQVPIASEHGIRGCYLLCRDRGKEFAPEERQRISDFASHTGLLLENQELLKRLQDANTGTLQLLRAAIEQRSPNLLHHSVKVAEMAKRLAQEMHLNKTTVEAVYRAGLLHDLGLLGLPDRIFQKTQGLKLEERAWIETHPVLAAEMLAAVPGLRPLVQAVRHHHERYDGQGYPDGLAGEEIPIEARILAVAEAFVTVSGTPSGPTLRADVHRPDRKAVLAEVERHAGTQFDPAVVQVLLSLEMDPQ